MDYKQFIESKKHIPIDFGFAPLWFPEDIFDFQQYIAGKAIWRGRMGVFLDTGLGKTRIALTIAQNMVQKTGRKVLILTPIAVAFQFLTEAEKIGIDDIEYSKNGKHTKKIVLCNYERLHYMNCDNFECVICDESSILKNFNGKIKFAITQFVKKVKYRFLMSATPSPNDFTEMGTSSEALGYLGYMDMLKYYFHNTKNDCDSRKDIGVEYILKPHAKNDFFAWISSWAIMIRMPSDIGYSDERYILPELIENVHFVKSQNFQENDGQLSMFALHAHTMWEIRNEQKQTEKQRCEKAVGLADKKVSVYWCNTNNESALLKNMDKQAVEIIGSQSIDQKEDILRAFSNRQIDRIITKSSITGMGLNWQHCNHCVFFPTWSYEQYYQSLRRFWRFGQKKDVTVDMVLSEGQKRVLQSLKEKKIKADQLYFNLLNSVNKNFEEIYIKSADKEIIMPQFIRVA